jgi:hypothetical protein
MIAYLIVIITLALPLFATLLLLFSQKNIRINYIIFFLTYETCYFCGGWIYISYYSKYALILLFIIFSIIYFKKNAGNKKFVFLNLSWKIFIIAVLILLNYLYLTSRGYGSKGINLNFPFKEGDYCIIAGGSNTYINFIHNTNSFSVYSYDIEKLNRYGCRSNSLFPQTLSDYEIFGKNVYSPCSGKIISVNKNIPDNIPPGVNEKEKTGNYVIIQSGNKFIMLAHFKQNTIILNQNDSILVNNFIGQAGNSGNSIEPHLHIEAHEKIDDHTYPLPILFDKEYFTYNDIIKK